MLDERLDILEKSLEKNLAPQLNKVTEPSKLDLVLFRISKWGLVGTITTLYVLAHQWNPFLGLIMTVLFAYCFAGLAHVIVDFVVYLFTNPTLLPEKADYLRDGIPSAVKVAMVRPIFAKSTQEMETLITNMRRDITANPEANRNLKFILIDNTRDLGVREYTRTRIGDLQNEFGDDVVFYFHRNHDCDFFKKLGIYQDLVMFLREGWTRPRHYTNPKWEAWTKQTRNPNKPLWDEVLGDIRALGIKATKEEVLAGGEVRVSEEGRIELALICDADNHWPPGQVRKLVAKMMHPANQEITIFQPSIELENPDENWFVQMNAWARSMYGFDPVAKWRLYRFCPFYGKGGMRLGPYGDEIIKAETIHPGKAASHDFQESLRSNTVLMEDCFILEKTFSNKLSELTRSAQWLWGDMETISQYLLKPFSAGRREHLWMLLRVAVGPLVFSLWFFGTVLAWLSNGIENGALLWTVFLSIAALSIVIPKFLVPYLGLFKEKGYSYQATAQLTGGPTDRKGRLTQVLMTGAQETVLSFLIHSLDLIYRPRATVQNLIKQTTGKEFVWITGQMGEIQTAHVSLGETYRILMASPITGGVLVALILLGIFPAGLSLFVAPYAVSFLLGPVLIWLTTKPVGSQVPKQNPPT